jgi:hypothetical protein
LYINAACKWIEANPGGTEDLKKLEVLALGLLLEENEYVVHSAIECLAKLGEMDDSKNRVNPWAQVINTHY